MAVKISLIHPSRGRAQKSFENSRKWVESAGLEVELIVSLDSTDQYLEDYKNFYFNVDCVLLVNDNKSVVEATNYAAAFASGDILIYLSDDFDCPPNWGVLVLKEFEGEERPLLLKVDDMLQKFEVPVLTIPIMNRKLYDTLKYFWHPEYKSMFVDECLYWTCLKLGAIKNARHLKFEHKHVSVGKAPDDETYRNSARNWEQGKALFAKHKAMGFPV